MPLRRVLVLVMSVLALALFAQALYWGPQLPERMASHFDLQNRVNGWMSRNGFLALTVGVEALMTVMFLALPLLLERIPDALINLPHKEYWLAPPRRAESLAQMSSGLLAIGCATLSLLFVIFHGIFALNADMARQAAGQAAGRASGSDAAAPDLSLPFLPLMGIYLAAVGGVTVWMLRRFRKPA